MNIEYGGSGREQVTPEPSFVDQHAIFVESNFLADKTSDFRSDEGRSLFGRCGNIIDELALCSASGLILADRSSALLVVVAPQ
jgi:hypothetical protein